LAFFREAQAITTNEALRKTITIESATSDERRFKTSDDRQQQQPQKEIQKKKLDRTITLPTGSTDNSNYRTQPGTRDMSVETKVSKRQAQQLQQIPSMTLSGDESYPWRSWQTSHSDNGRKDIETWWTSQFQMSA